MKRLYDLLFRLCLQTKWDSNFLEIRVSSPFKFLLLSVFFFRDSDSSRPNTTPWLIKMLFLTNKSLLIISFEKGEESHNFIYDTFIWDRILRVADWLAKKLLWCKWGEALDPLIWRWFVLGRYALTSLTNFIHLTGISWGSCRTTKRN